MWERDNGKCVKCGSDSNLHFDHIIPYSKGGTSLSSKNIQLLCMTCNLAKSDKIE
ncbi:MAG: HNH endonuclease [Chloroflexota bacterium]